MTHMLIDEPSIKLHCALDKFAFYSLLCLPTRKLLHIICTIRKQTVRMIHTTKKSCASNSNSQQLCCKSYSLLIKRSKFIAIKISFDALRSLPNTMIIFNSKLEIQLKYVNHAIFISLWLFLVINIVFSITYITDAECTENVQLRQNEKIFSILKITIAVLYSIVRNNIVNKWSFSHKCNQTTETLVPCTWAYNTWKLFCKHEVVCLRCVQSVSTTNIQLSFA